MTNTVCVALPIQPNFVASNSAFLPSGDNVWNSRSNGRPFCTVRISVPSFGRAIVEIVGGGKPAGAGHVLRDDGGMARDVPADMTRHEPAVGVVAAAGGGADQQRDLLAGVEVRLRGCLAGRQHQRSGEHEGGFDPGHRPHQPPGIMIAPPFTATDCPVM